LLAATKRARLPAPGGSAAPISSPRSASRSKPIAAVSLSVRRLLDLTRAANLDLITEWLEIAL
jgi:hypothetical protein